MICTMKNTLKFKLILFAISLLLGVTAQAQPRRSVAQLRTALTNVVGQERAQKMNTVLQRNRVSVLSDDDAGFAVVNSSSCFPAVLAYGDRPFDNENPSPEFLYLLELYDAAIAKAESAGASGMQTLSDEVQSDESWAAVGPLLTTKWAQGSPYNNKCPLYDGGTSRCVTGCVATAMAQVLNFWELPKTMHGFKTYGYVNGNGHRVNHSFDYTNTVFDWDSMKDSYTLFASSREKEAVATLMYACGVGTGMRYSPSESGANPWIGADAINCFMDGIRADHMEYNLDRILVELKAGRPVIYSGSSSSGGAHCFVIDGCDTSGRLHLNLGWGGGNDGYYVPTDMAGYAVQSQGIDCVYPSDYVPTYTPISEIAGKYASASHVPATSVESNKWYVLWNAGRSGSPVSNGVGKEITNTSLIPEGYAVRYCANQLVRFVPRSNGGFYIQTGVGDYFGSFAQWGSGTTTTSKSNYFYVTPIQTGYFAIHSTNSSCYLDTNGPGGTVVGWGNTMPSDTVSNSSWRFYPVTFTDTDPNAGLGIGSEAKFDSDKFYTIKNTGYSQGYLVAMSATDANPTLRGVTTNHTNGLYAGAAYRDAVDVYNEGMYWQILTENGRHYLVNYATKKYLTNGGNETPYVFTETPTPINIAKMDDGTYRFNSGTNAKSYLCAATHLSNPAAFWEVDDAGSVWQVEESEIMRPYVGVTGLSLDMSETVGFVNSPIQVAATIQPANATDATIVWTSSDESVARVSDTGEITPVAIGEVTITATSVDNTNATASVHLRILKKTAKGVMSDFEDGDVCLLCNVGSGPSSYSQGYLVALDGGDEHPTVRGVKVIHPTQGCCDDHYLDDADLLSPYAYWQIFSDGTTRYLYNVGVGKFLSNTGEQTHYVFTDIPTPINVSLNSTGVFRFNSGTDAKSYLSVATHHDNPAAFWTSNDVGTRWSIEAVEGLELAPADFFDAADQTIGDLVKGVVRYQNSEITLEAFKNIRRMVLRRKDTN